MVILGDWGVFVPKRVSFWFRLGVITLRQLKIDLHCYRALTLKRASPFIGKKFLNVSSLWNHIRSLVQAAMFYAPNAIRRRSVTIPLSFFLEKHWYKKFCTKSWKYAFKPTQSLSSTLHVSVSYNMLGCQFGARGSEQTEPRIIQNIRDSRILKDQRVHLKDKRGGREQLRNNKQSTHSPHDSGSPWKSSARCRIFVHAIPPCHKNILSCSYSPLLQLFQAKILYSINMEAYQCYFRKENKNALLCISYGRSKQASAAPHELIFILAYDNNVRISLNFKRSNNHVTTRIWRDHTFNLNQLKDTNEVPQQPQVNKMQYETPRRQVQLEQPTPNFAKPHVIV